MVPEKEQIGLSLWLPTNCEIALTDTPPAASMNLPAVQSIWSLNPLERTVLILASFIKCLLNSFPIISAHSEFSLIVMFPVRCWRTVTPHSVFPNPDPSAWTPVKFWKQFQTATKLQKDCSDDLYKIWNYMYQYILGETCWWDCEPIYVGQVIVAEVIVDSLAELDYSNIIISIWRPKSWVNEYTAEIVKII